MGRASALRRRGRRVRAVLGCRTARSRGGRAGRRAHPVRLPAGAAGAERHRSARRDRADDVGRPADHAAAGRHLLPQRLRTRRCIAHRAGPVRRAAGGGTERRGRRRRAAPRAAGRRRPARRVAGRAAPAVRRPGGAGDLVPRRRPDDGAGPLDRSGPDVHGGPDAGRGPAARLRFRTPAAGALHPRPRGAGEVPAAAVHPPRRRRRLVRSGDAARAAGAVQPGWGTARAARTGRVSELPELVGVPRPWGIHRRVAAGARGVGRAARPARRPRRGRARRAQQGRRAPGDGDERTEPARPRARSHRQHPGARCVGPAARAAHRPARRTVRLHGVGSRWRPARHRIDGGPVHQHRAGASATRSGRGDRGRARALAVGAVGAPRTPVRGARRVAPGHRAAGAVPDPRRGGELPDRRHRDHRSVGHLVAHRYSVRRAPAVPADADRGPGRRTAPRGEVRRGKSVRRDGRADGRRHAHHPRRSSGDGGRAGCGDRTRPHPRARRRRRHGRLPGDHRDRAARRPGRPHAGRDRGGVRGAQSVLRAAARPREPAGARPRRPRRPARDEGGRRAAAFDRTDGRAARDRQGGWCLRPARHRLPGRAPVLHARGFGPGVRADVRRCRSRLAGQRNRTHPRRRPGPGRMPGRSRVRRPAPAASAVRHLHVRVDGASEGRRRPALRRREPPAVDAGVPADPAHRPGAAEDAVELRRLGTGVLRSAARGCHAGAGAAGRTPRSAVSGGVDRRRRDHARPLRAVDARTVPRRADGERLHGPAGGRGQRRGAAVAGRPTLRRCAARCGARQPLRAHRGCGRGQLRRRGAGAARGRGDGADRAGRRQHRALRARSVPAAGHRWIRGRALSRGPAVGPRLPRPSGDERGPFRRRPVRDVRRSHVSHRRRRATEHRRRRRIPGPCRRPGEAAWIPDRVGRDRVPARRAPRRGPGGRCRAGGRARPPATRRVPRRSPRRGRGRSAQLRGEDPAGVHGSDRPGGRRGATAEPQRQTRSPCAAGAGCPRRHGADRDHPRGRARPGGRLADSRGARPRAGGRGRRLLRARGRQHPRDPARQPGSPRGHLDHAPADLRAADASCARAADR